MLMKSSKEIIQVLREAKSYFLSTILIQPLNGLTQSLHSYWTRQLPNGITERIVTVYTFFLRNLKQCRLTHLMAGVNPHKMKFLLCFVLISSTGSNHRCLSDTYFKNEWNWWLTDRIFAVMFITEFFLKQKKKKVLGKNPTKNQYWWWKTKPLPPNQSIVKKIYSESASFLLKSSVSNETTQDIIEEDTTPTKTITPTHVLNSSSSAINILNAHSKLSNYQIVLLPTKLFIQTWIKLTLKITNWNSHTNSPTPLRKIVLTKRSSWNWQQFFITTINRIATTFLALTSFNRKIFQWNISVEDSSKIVSKNPCMNDYLKVFFQTSLHHFSWETFDQIENINRNIHERK